MDCMERAMVILEADALNSTMNSAKKTPNEVIHPITRNATMKSPEKIVFRPLYDIKHDYNVNHFCFLNM